MTLLAAWAGVEGLLKLYSPRIYSLKYLDDLILGPSILSFPIPLEQFYFPVLVQYELKDRTVVVTIFKQFVFGPFKGIWWTPIATDNLWQVMPKYDSNTKRITAPVYFFGLSDPRFILRTLEGESSLLLSEESAESD